MATRCCRLDLHGAITCKGLIIQRRLKTLEQFLADGWEVVSELMIHSESEHHSVCISECGKLVPVGFGTGMHYQAGHVIWPLEWSYLYQPEGAKAQYKIIISDVDGNETTYKADNIDVSFDKNENGNSAGLITFALGTASYEQFYEDRCNLSKVNSVPADK